MVIEDLAISSFHQDITVLFLSVHSFLILVKDVWKILFYFSHQ